MRPASVFVRDLLPEEGNRLKRLSRKAASEVKRERVGLTYACIGALAGAALGQLGATYLVLFLAMLDIGILQDPMFGDGTPGGLAYAFPDYGAGRVIIDGAFSAGFHAWSELALALGWLAVLGLGWLAVLGLAVTWVLRRLLRSAA
jgi:hypothetical protein